MVAEAEVAREAVVVVVVVAVVGAVAAEVEEEEATRDCKYLKTIRSKNY